MNTSMAKEENPRKPSIYVSLRFPCLRLRLKKGKKFFPHDTWLDVLKAYNVRENLRDKEVYCIQKFRLSNVPETNAAHLTDKIEGLRALYKKQREYRLSCCLINIVEKTEVKNRSRGRTRLPIFPQADTPNLSGEQKSFYDSLGSAGGSRKFNEALNQDDDAVSQYGDEDEDAEAEEFKKRVLARARNISPTDYWLGGGEWNREDEDWNDCKSVVKDQLSPLNVIFDDIFKY
ncbi:uncharacterized protein LOC110850538 [Folsomia candida]|uniref:Uncharacterized protein n=1 Tax=Folsomia candida TaxID=158441 RepID=A0A226EBF4_FOLCA|nr:uncharacterized protein LOC110850538 [Folsomia candida]OXA54111.1 hypothetical protein Fcan01_11727 [Folsomia candida]